jgi:hypothetical protein
MKFTCPQCGTFCYGSSQNRDGTLTRECHGFGDGHQTKPGPCNFTWHEDDDHLYFRPDSWEQGLDAPFYDEPASGPP